jgi:hypothetical protein
MVIGFISVIAIVTVFGIVLVDFMKQINEKGGAETEHNELNEQIGQNWQNRQPRHNRRNRQNRQNKLVLVVPRSYQ